MTIPDELVTASVYYFFSVGMITSIALGIFFVWYMVKTRWIHHEEILTKEVE